MMKILATSLIALSLVGCATSRGLIEIPQGQKLNQSQNIVAQGKSIIVKVEDDRKFQDKPASADIPSLKGEQSNATAEEKARAVARKRNGYGKALGDILLKDETVSHLVDKRVSDALQLSGYKVLSNNPTNEANADLILNIKINKFWSWFQPGFASIKINSEIDTEIVDAKHPNRPPFKIYSKVTRSAQVANESKWVENIDKVLNDYQEKLIVELSKQSQ